MSWNFDNERPIYKQLVEQLKLFIINGTYPLGERLPSVRDLAFESKVNPNTMQRALNELEDLELIFTERTNGKFVTMDKKRIESLKQHYAKEKVINYVDEMGKLGFTMEEVIYYFDKYRKEKM